MSTDPFVEHRPLLFTIAYELLGSAADAEDVLQETWLRWSAAVAAAEEPGREIRDPRAYLVATVTRQGLNHLRTLRRRREDYVGPWLPEPVRTAADPAADAELTESVSMAMLLVLETLSPIERAVFVLGEVFGFSGAEIAAATGRTPAAVRQTAHRAREHVRARRPRFEASPEQRAQVARRFVVAAQAGDLAGLMDVLAPDVVSLSDGGGLASAARHPIRGAEKVAAFVSGLVRTAGNGTRWEEATYNGLPAVVVRRDGAVEVVALVETSGDAVTALYFVRNPEKLGGVDEVRPLVR
ncbi:RNA polymerase sigma-70 factor [Isoptericola sp. b515]|uniref:RNA polymerase sigma-70 factor n=1 Tax=Isoptericola sp. b515 TaxID=3064652 RepID=UPI002712338F|nr:RNA polymerase sigma-70 factor [Isoptericola sp. b515]MDO8147626.1 RNA polymerase sigma-70 factor [Isoptericola sp. b515]